ncbi:GTPase [Sterolibacterium denitrificans]|uniref:tRNA modification GTPase MnmE n=1 Tax=Sterolibacterium denitrificans TaxID=157592 RepID=A0A7Z7HP08_9PROT|nr:tRNA uridine-5-carboxymethylaminomethyl(34) synthesis GTPase MnmE [Sterolibacterium denitrificans]SMB21665.1 GTPase [Sterolibacterium denitrificans]
MNEETIAAVATAPGRGGIGVVRVSGPRLTDFARRLCGLLPLARQATLTDFRDGQGRTIDRGILLYFPAPHSFTGEDVLELQGHGGPVVLHLLLQRCLELGARLAEPGEFTRRAFLNDKLDLAQAEAVADLIDASSVQAVRSALRSLSGEFSRQVHGIVDRLIELRMLIEATLDFPDEEIDAATLLREANVMSRLEQLRADLAGMQRRARQGSLLRSGLQVVLAGPPNVGKSSLLNRLAGEERAIVTEIAGTTRDTVRELIQVEGIPLHIIDTAGLRETGDTIEKLGIERSWQEIERADVILQLVDACDARHGLTAEDVAIAGQLPERVERIVIHNKCDLSGEPAGRSEEGGQVHLRLSARSGQGIELLHAELLRVAGWQEHGEDLILARERHLQALQAADSHLAEALIRGDALEFCAEELRGAQEALGEITGKFTADDLLGAIFSRFCIGK